MSTPTDLNARYGAPAPWRRTALITVVSLMGVAFVGFVLWAAAFHSSPEVQSEATRYKVIDDYSVMIELSVDVRDDIPLDTVECKVQATAEDKSIVGELTFEPIQGAQQVTLRTERRATNATKVGCRTDEQPRWR